MEFSSFKSGVIIALVALLGGCDSTESMLGGTGVGVATGALIGHAVGGRGGAALGGVLGGLGGSAIGHSIGRKQTEAKTRAAQAEEEARYLQRENDYLRSQHHTGGASGYQEGLEQKRRLEQLKFEAEEARLKSELERARAEQAEAEHRRREIERKHERDFHPEYRYQDNRPTDAYAPQMSYAH